MHDEVKLATRARLLVAGAAVFADKGFEGGSVREICKQAQTSANMVHHYFGSKAGLLEAIVEQFGSRLLAVPMRLLETPAKSCDDFRSRIEMLFEATLDAYLEQRAVVMVVVREQIDAPALSEYMARFASFLEHGQTHGFVREGLDTQMMTGALLDRIVNQVQFAPWIRRNYGVDLWDPVYKKRWCASNIDLFLYGMLA